MNYPAWDVPFLGSGWVIGLIAIFHIMISHFAIGGGLYLPLAEYTAIKHNRRDWLEFLPRHSKFFLILTGVYGAVSGVGIWFAIGLASPESTSTLIHNFVFGWAIEWVFFIIELSSAAVYYYTWKRIPQKLHLMVGWLYAFTSFCTLFVINGILTFMLTPGQTWLSVAGTGTEADVFFSAFFNPGFWPSLFLRTLVCLSLAGIWALVTGSLLDGDTQGKLKTLVIRWSALWLLPGFFLMPVFVVWYLFTVPASQAELLSFGVSTIGAGTFTQVTRTILISVMSSATIVGVVYFIAYRSPREFRFGYACMILLVALMATGSTEKAREMLRKPYTVGEFMYSSNIRKLPTQHGDESISDVDRFNRDGYLRSSIWASEELKLAWQAEDAAAGIVQVATAAALESPSDATLQRGLLMFQGQCLSCHTREGYRSMHKFLQDRDIQSIRNILGMLHSYREDSPYRSFMPPLVGSDQEIEALAQYLNSLVNPIAGGGTPKAVALAQPE